MKKFFSGIISLAAAALTAAAVTSGVFADEFVYAFDDATLVDEIKADTYDIDGTEISIEKELGDADADPGMSVRCVLFNEYIDVEFWNDPNVTVSVDARLDTEGADVIGYIIGFDSKWTWINPSNFTTLKYNEWVTITESGEHFYQYFQKNEPLRLLFQTRLNWGVEPQGSVKVTLKNFRISDGAAAEPTVEPSVSESSDAETQDASSPAVSSTPAADTSSDVPTSSSVPETSIQTVAAASTSVNYADINLISEQTEKSTAMVLIIIIVVAVVVVAGIVVGYLIYKKKKYY